MNKPGSFSPDDALEDEAALWLCERDEGFTPGRAREFSAWVSADPRRAQAVARVEQTLALLAEMPAVRRPLEARVGRVDQPRDSRTSRRAILRFPRAAWVSGLAAAVVLGLGLWTFNSRSSVAGEEFETAATVQRQMGLRDGSIVEMNAGSKLHVLFTERERHITLESGEAHFTVAHNKDWPFIVTAGGVSVRAVGTAFNVRFGTGAVDVLVVEGKVEVAQRAASVATESVEARPLLVAGEQASISRLNPVAKLQVESATPTALGEILAWQDRITTFTDVPLRDLVVRLNRHNSTQLVLEDAELGARKIGGHFALNQVETLVRLLEEDGIVVDRTFPDRIVLRRAR